MLRLTLMNNKFDVPCSEEEKDDLIKAATLLEDKLDQIPHLKGENKVLMVALNLCYDYLQLKQDCLNYADHQEKNLAQTMQSLLELE